jgi:hypothetical protein
MSDPFPSVERESKITLRVLEVLARHKYPTVISTKSDLFAQEEYLGVLQTGSFAIQASVSTLDDRLAARTDLGTPGPTKLLSALANAIDAGIPGSLRLQPLLPTRQADAADVIDAGADVGVRHVAVEHLKLPVEKTWWGTETLSDALGVNLPKYYACRLAKRIGREWVLPVEERLDTVLQLRHRAHGRGMSFGAADNDLLLLSDGGCCCSGVDDLPGFERYFRCNYTEAVRRGLSQGTIQASSLNAAWAPTGSVRRFVNSRSRSGAASVREYVLRNWNGSPNGSSPALFYGVRPVEAFDDQGYRVYSVTDELLEFLRVRDIR